MAAWAMFAFIREFWAANLLVIVAVGGLAAIAYFTRSLWFAMAAVGVVTLSIFAGVLYKRGYSAKADEDRAEMARVIAAREKTITELTAENERRSAEDNESIAILQRQINATPKNSATGLDRKSAARVRGIR